MVRPKNQEISRQKTVEVQNDLHDKPFQFMENFNNRLTLNNLRLVERYINMELHLLLHLRMKNGVEFIANLELDRSNVQQGVGKVRNGVIGARTYESSDNFGSFRWRHASCRIREAGGEKQAVFIDLVKFMETPERVVPTFVWFEDVERFYDILPKNLYFSTNLSRHVFCGTFDDWELRPSACTVGGQGKLAGQVIERAPQVVQYVTNDIRNGERYVGEFGDVIRTLSRFKIVLDTDSVWYGFPSGIQRDESGNQVLDVLLGPFDF